MLAIFSWALSSASGAGGVTPPGSTPHPVDLPAGPQSTSASCPNPPDLSSPLPTGATISVPSLVPAGTASLSSGGETYDLAGSCQYTLSLPSNTVVATPSGQLLKSPAASPDGISITFVSSGSDFYFPTGVADPIVFSYGGHACDTTAEIVSAFGFAIAEQTLTSGNCTSNSADPGASWGYAEAVNTALAVAPAIQEPTFHTQYQSAEGGSIFFGQFQECMETPLGQQSTYVCANDNYSPLF
jgi:hypothetical protein